MSKELETTYYRFQSEVRAFLSKLLKNPVDAQPSKYLKDREFTRKKLIDELLKRDVIERHEKILDRTNSDEKEAKYVVKFKVHKKDFEKRIHRIYIKFFEKNVNESVEEMQAYHGSPKKFRRFKESRISTCNYGWGTYVATDYTVGKKYAKKNGYVYEVSIPDDNGHNYIHGGKISEEEYNKIYSVLIKAFPDYKDEILRALYMSHHRFTNCYAPIFNSEGIKGIPATSKEISQLFAANGYVGITWEWLGYVVIFNPEDVKIVNRSRVAESVEEMQAYHGSPKKFNRFKNSRVGKHNFYGWGTYVSFDYEQGKRYARGNGYFYEVSIPDDNGTNYLHIREERPEVYDWVYSILKQELPKFSSSFYGVIEKCKKWKDFTPLFGWEMEPIEKQISKALEKHGIIGLMVVPDQPYCVIFNAKNVKIMNRARVAESVNEEAELRSCANVIGVVGGGKPGETADRWAKYVNGNENGFKRQVFSNEDDMKKRILNGPDGDVYRKRGGINEEGEGGGMAAGGDGSGGATSTSSVASETTRGDLGYDVPFKEVQRRGIYVGAQGEKRSTNPILGKTITAEAKKGRRIFITEEQYEMILKEEGLGAGGATTTTSVASETTRGDLGYDVPFLGKAKGKSKSKFLKPAMDREPGFSVERMK